MAKKKLPYYYSFVRTGDRTVKPEIVCPGAFGRGCGTDLTYGVSKMVRDKGKHKSHHLCRKCADIEQGIRDDRGKLIVNETATDRIVVRVGNVVL